MKNQKEKKMKNQKEKKSLSVYNYHHINEVLTLANP